MEEDKKKEKDKNKNKRINIKESELSVDSGENAEVVDDCKVEDLSNGVDAVDLKDVDAVKKVKVEDKASGQKSYTEEVKRAYEYRKNGYNIKDSSLAFLLGGFCSPILAVLAVSIIFSIASALSGMEYATLVKTRPYDIIAMLCAEIGFAIYFIILQFSKPKRVALRTPELSSAYIASLEKRKFKDCVGFSFKKFDWLVCAVVVLLAITMSLLCAQFIDVVNYGLNSIGYTKDSSLPFKIDSVGEMILGLVTMALIPAICEEFLFRGVVLGGLLNGAKTKKARILCVLLSALIFALIHQSALQLVYPFIMGCVFGFVYMYTGNLIYSIILHFVSNGLVIVINFINNASGATASAITYNASFILGSIALLILALGLAFGGILLIKCIYKNKSQFVQDERQINAYANYLKVQEIVNAENIDESSAEIKVKEEAEKFVSAKSVLIGKIVICCGLAFGVIVIVADLISTIISA